MLATVLVTLSLCTATLGVALMFTGYFKLAGLVQYLPLPVVGGYLAFIGLYCLEAGISLMTGMQIDNLLGLRAVQQWGMLLQPQPLYYCVPGVVIGIAILLVLQRYHHFLVLPGLLLAIPVAFYLITAILGFSLEDCREMGLVAAEEPQGNPFLVWTMFDFAHVRWDLVPKAFPTWCGMYIVVAFSSSLDAALRNKTPATTWGATLPTKCRRPASSPPRPLKSANVLNAANLNEASCAAASGAAA